MKLPNYTLHTSMLALLVVCACAANAVPIVTFNPSSLTVAASSDYDTPPLIVQNATGVTAVNIEITIPADLTVDTTTSGSSLACITQGSSVGGLFFAEWNASQRKISIACAVNAGATLEILDKISFSTGSTVTSEEMILSGSVTGGTGTATFTDLSILPPHTVTFTTEPTANATTINSAGTTNCSADAVDSHGHSVIYAWSDGGSGGSFSPNASSKTPTYTAAANTTTANKSVTLTCNATCSQTSTVKATDTVVLTVRPKLAGDVDGDQDVDKTDADLVIQALFGDISTTSVMDANGDGSVTIADAQWILAHPRAAG